MPPMLQYTICSCPFCCDMLRCNWAESWYQELLKAFPVPVCCMTKSICLACFYPLLFSDYLLLTRWHDHLHKCKNRLPGCTRIPNRCHFYIISILYRFYYWDFGLFRAVESEYSLVYSDLLGPAQIVNGRNVWNSLLLRRCTRHHLSLSMKRCDTTTCWQMLLPGIRVNIESVSEKR
jgi:hypothetical protein